MYRGLNRFIEDLDRRQELLRVRAFVHPELEIAEIADRVSKSPQGGKALLFENTGTPFPVLINAFGSEARMALALGAPSIAGVSQAVEGLLQTLIAPRPSLLSKLQLLPQLRRVARWMPKSVGGRGECQQVVHRQPDLGMLPILKTWPHDGGRFITLPMVITRDPLTGSRNVGMYRMQVLSGVETGMHWHRHKTGAKHYQEHKRLGRRMPIAVALGGDPAYTYAATAPLPDNIDEFILAGFLRGQSVRLVRCLTNDLEVPADADIVIEGYVDPAEDLVWEGPFGDHTGFYSLADWYPKFHVTCITHRHDAVYPATVVGIPPMEDVYLAKATERIFLWPLRFTLLPELTDMHLPPQGAAHNLAILKISKQYPGHAHKVASALWGAGQMMFTKIMAIVDGDCDIRNPLALARRVSECFDPMQGLLTTSGPMDVLDHASHRVGFGGKLLLDATGRLADEPGEIPSQRYPADALERLLARRPDGVLAVDLQLMGMGISAIAVAIDKAQGHSVRGCVAQLLAQLGEHIPKLMVAVDRSALLHSPERLAWYVLGNAEPAADCYLAVSPSGQRACLVVDGSSKAYAQDAFPRPWPNVVVADMPTVQRVDELWEALALGPFIPSPSLAHQALLMGAGPIARPASD